MTNLIYELADDSKFVNNLEFSPKSLKYLVDNNPKVAIQILAEIYQLCVSQIYYNSYQIKEYLSILLLSQISNISLVFG